MQKSIQSALGPNFLIRKWKTLLLQDTKKGRRHTSTFFRLRRLPPSRKKVKGFCFHWVQKVLGVAMIVGLAVLLAVAGVVSLFFSMKSNSKVENAKS